MSAICHFCRITGNKVISFFKKKNCSKALINFNSTCLEHKLIPVWAKIQNPNITKNLTILVIKNRIQFSQKEWINLYIEFGLQKT